MRGFRRRGCGAAAGAICVVFALGSAAAVASPQFSLTQVSSDPFTNTTSFHATELEPDTFGFGSTLVSAFQSGRFSNGGASDIGWATSINAGTSYSHGFLPGTTAFSTPTGPYARVSDPAVAFDAKHGIWLISSLPLTSSLRGAAVIVNRSENGGVTFGRPINVTTATGSQDLDKDWITCDDTATSPHYGSCYVQWDDPGNGNVLHMAFSRDGGLTWSQATVPPAIVIGGQPVVQPTGTVVVPIDNAFESAIESFVSTDGGATYTGPFPIATISSHTEAGNLRSGPLPTAEVDGAGKVYAAWSDCRFITSCAANDIVFSTSTNGTTWSPVTRIPIDATTTGRDHFLPGLAVDRNKSGATAKLGLTYYFYPTSNCSTATCQLDVGYIRSEDGGSTWKAPIQLAGPSSLNELPLTTQGYMVGDYTSTSFVTGPTHDLGLTVFAVGLPVAGTTCTLGALGSCNEPMDAPSAGLVDVPAPTGVAPARVASAAGVVSRRSDRRPPARPLTER